MWNIIKKIFKTLLDIEFYEDKKYMDWLADKNTEPMFKLKDENDSRFGTSIEDEPFEDEKNKKV